MSTNTLMSNRPEERREAKMSVCYRKVIVSVLGDGMELRRGCVIEQDWCFIMSHSVCKHTLTT